MIEKGYERFDIYNTVASDCKLSLTYANPAWSAKRPKGGYEYTIKHTGISAIYDVPTKIPHIVGLCIPNGLKAFLLAYNEMNPKTQDFVLSQTKQCNGCRYCVQTDKTGSRSLAIVKISHDGNEHNMCPYFPGYSYSWTSIDDVLVDQLIEMLSFQIRLYNILRRKDHFVCFDEK
jgi:hypothetical protein